MPLETFQIWSDTGGSESDPHVLVPVALIATARKWARFNARWNRVLAGHKVQQLHMFEFAHFKGAFSSWRGEDARRRAFLAELISTIKHGINKTYITGVVLPDYREADSRFQLTEMLGGPYSLGQAGALFRAFDWLWRTRPSQSGIQAFIEKGDAGQGAFMQFLRRERSWLPEIVPKVDPATGLAHPAFQAADFIAYEHRLAYQKRVEMGVAPKLRGSFEALRESLPIDVGIADQVMIAQFIESQRVPPRKSSLPEATLAS